MARALHFLSFVAVLTELGKATQSALELLSEEENEFHQRRLDFDNWCNRELENQEKQRKELSELQGEDQTEDTEQFEVSEMLLELARQLRPSAPPLRRANVTLTALQAVERDLAARAPRFFFGGTRGLQAVQKLLQEARDKVNGFSLAQTDRASLEAKLEVLKAEEKKNSEVLAARRAKGLAAHSGHKVLETALAQTEASLSEAAGLCGLGRTVLNRSEATGQMLSRKALELIGMVEGSPAAGSVASAASLPPVVSKQSSAAAPVASDLLAVSQQLQLQQQQVQQQLEELRQMKAAAPPLQKAPTEPSRSSLMEEHEDLDRVEPPSDPPTRPLTRKKSKASMSLAAETAEASKSEASHGKIEAVKMQDAATPAPKAVPAAKAYAKSKEVDEDSNHLQAPKDFPAALRGGWQALLAKKRAEGFKKSSAKVEEHSSIMDLMQTPKTYTAWQPDKGPSQPAEKAKEDLLAAEKTFDDDDEIQAVLLAA